MRLLISAAVATLALAVALLAACSPRGASAPASNAASSKTNTANGSATGASAPQSSLANVPAATPGDDVARVTEGELTAAMMKSAVMLYDVRDKASYEAGHIKGAKNVPWEEVERRLSEFPKDKQIVTYCA
jgi:hypothetical protein